MICPNCREDNASNFRFCGMCGTSLEPRRTTGTAALDPLSALSTPVSQPTAPPKTVQPRVSSATEPLRSLAMAGATSSVKQQVPAPSGPSMLGLDRPVANQIGVSESKVSRSDAGRSNTLDEPTLDSLRERSFSGLDSFLEPEESHSGPGRILLLIVLLAALGAAGWWTYTNYVSVAEGRKPQAATSNTGSASTENTPGTAVEPVAQNAQAPNMNSPQSSPQSTAPSAQVPEGPSENTNPRSTPSTKQPETTAKAADETRTVASVPLTPAPVSTAQPKTVPAYQKAPSPQAAVTSVKSANLSSATGSNTGDADFRRGEAYLYGRGAPENCTEAVKNLKAASAKANAKARSAFGTMYATGHCVPRDLPTSYLWFALALRVDPNNQILEKDLNAIWNQMTPPERQIATRMKE